MALQDFYPWAKAANMYIDQGTLIQWMQEHPSLLIVDVRDDDAVGGNIKGSMHCPDSTFVPDGLQLVRDCLTGGHSAQETRVVFHCMESARRGPRCARRLYDSLNEEPLEGFSSSNIFVLKGGADLWIRRFWGDKSLVEAYDDAFWGFETPAAGSSPHSLYQRPPDQLSTEWSAAGADLVKGKEE